MPNEKNIKKKPKKKPAKKVKGNFTDPTKKKRVQRPEKMVQVTLPAVIPGRGVYEPEPPPSIYEITYKDAMLAVEMEKLAAKGLTNDQIIDLLPLSRATFYQRLKDDPYFSYCLGKHRGNPVNEVESALKMAATGFGYEEEHCSANGKVVTLSKFKTPDIAAAKFFLTNRAPNEWKNKVEQTHQVGEGMQAMAFVIKRREE